MDAKTRKRGRILTTAPRCATRQRLRVSVSGSRRRFMACATIRTATRSSPNFRPGQLSACRGALSPGSRKARRKRWPTSRSRPVTRASGWIPLTTAYCWSSFLCWLPARRHSERSGLGSTPQKNRQPVPPHPALMVRSAEDRAQARVTFSLPEVSTPNNLLRFRPSARERQRRRLSVRRVSSVSKVSGSNEPPTHLNMFSCSRCRGSEIALTKSR
jgi:hypothetical protein